MPMPVITDWDIERYEVISFNKNRVIIRDVAPGAIIGVVDPKTRDLLLYGQADDYGCFEGEVPVKSGENKVVRIRVRYPQDPALEVEAFVGMPLKRGWTAPQEDWMDKLYG